MSNQPTEHNSYFPEYLLLGEILRPHGVRGEVRMRIITDYPERLKELKTLYLGKSRDDKHPIPATLQKARFHKEYALLTIKGYNSRESADKLRKKFVMVDIDNAVPLEDGEYYLFQLVGLKIVVDNQEIGIVKEVLQTGANDVYIADSEQYGEILIPAHSETIIEVNFDTKTITMSLPDGLLSSS